MEQSDVATDLLERLDDAEMRLELIADHPFPAGFTDPDPGGEERWDAPRVWAHVAEFVPYWTSQVRLILAGPPGEPAPFGRTAADPARSAAIERDRLLPPEELWRRVRAGIDGAKAAIAEMPPSDWDRLGMHPVRGPVSVGFVFEQFVAKHLDEHCAQLQKLASEG